MIRNNFQKSLFLNDVLFINGRTKKVHENKILSQLLTRESKLIKAISIGDYTLWMNNEIFRQWIPAFAVTRPKLSTGVALGKFVLLGLIR